MKLYLLKVVMTYGFLIIIVSSCKKYLDKKPNQSLVVPNSVQDLQALLDRFNFINQRDPGVTEETADDYYLTNSVWASSAEQQRRIYTWEKDNLFRPGTSNDWAFRYNNIYTANVVLYNIDKIKVNPNEQEALDNVKGQAFFIRGREFLLTAWNWALAYDQATADSDLGIPLRLDPDFNTPSVRSTLQQTYNQIVQDIRTSVDLLPHVSVHVMRPSKAAAYALLARTYLSMRIYDSCLKYSDLCLQIKSDLMDFNNDPQINQTATFPFTPFNKEVIYESVMPYPANIFLGNVDSMLYRSYNIDDKRLTLFFKPGGIGSSVFKGNYEGGGNLFDGIATDEVYLMRAECHARNDNKDAALAELNTLMRKRWKNTVPYPIITASSSTEAIDKILIERRKELVFRGLRWMDIKRLNKEGRNIILKRFLNGQMLILNPNDLRYALPIPEDVIAISGMPQNPR